MRRIGAIALVLVTGCSLVWDMDPYERGEESASKKGQSSGGASGGAKSSPEEDAGREGKAPACDGEVEPNDTPGAATEIREGRACGRLEDKGDLDYWTVTATSEEVTVTITIQAGMQIVVMAEASGPSIIQTAGRSHITLGSGTHVFLIQTANGTLGAYEIER